MNYKPNEETLMAYLYGELEGNDKELFQLYLQEHPDEMKRMEDMRSVMNIIGAVGDQEVIASPVFTDGHESARIFWRSSAFKTIISIAASMMLLLVAGKMLSPDITFGNGELRMSFGDRRKSDIEKPAMTSLITADSVQRMINVSLLATSRSMDSRWAANQQRLDNSIHRSLDQNSRKVDEMIKNTAQASQEQLRSYVSGLQTENLRLIKDYFQLSAKEQNDYVEKLMVGFSKYVQEQRAQDMLLVQHKMENIEKDSDQFKQETEQLLASIISSKPKKSY